LLANVFTGPAIQVAAATVDLSPAIALLPASLITGRTARIAILVTNSGNVPATGPLTIEIFASAGQSTSGAQLLGTVVTKVSLNPGKAKKYTIAFKPPTALVAGSYYLSAQLTPGAAIPDTDLSDRIVYSAVQVAVSTAPVHIHK